MTPEAPRFDLITPSSICRTFDYLEWTLRIHNPVADPFVSVQIEAEFTHEAQSFRVEGFCDASDGRVFRVRFMPVAAGHYTGEITVKTGETAQAFGDLSFTAVEGSNKGMLEVDPDFPHHFRWSGTHEPFFWNATTAYLMAGLSEDQISAALDRLADWGVNRVRVSLCPSRQKDGGRWYEAQVGHREDFTYCYSPWLCRQPDHWDDPQPDTARFDTAYWQKFERLLLSARKRHIIVQVIFFTDAQEPQNYPFDREKFGDDPGERRYYAYALARLGAFSNVEYCLTNEWRLFRPNEWAEQIGAFVEAKDVYGHPTSIHGHEIFPFRESRWADFALFQMWDEHGAYDFMLTQRRAQDATGKPKPQINEEYGYEDHYPGPWGGGRKAPARAADTRRRFAWEIAMAGCYQTTGESAANGLGGWINGLGDDTMTMLGGYRHLVSFFTAFDWRQLEPVDSPIAGVLCLAGAGRIVLYLRQETVSQYLLAAAVESVNAIGHTVRWYNPRTGQYTNAPDVSGEWVCLLESRES